MVTNVEAPSSGAAEGAMGTGDADGAEAATDDADETVDAAHVNVVDRNEGAVDAKDIMTGMLSKRDDMFMFWSRDEIFLRVRDTNDIGRWTRRPARRPLGLKYRPHSRLLCGRSGVYFTHGSTVEAEPRSDRSLSRPYDRIAGQTC